jgi:DNA-binding transcriptional MerR regulator/predicted transcriptional regulator YdeE
MLKIGDFSRLSQVSIETLRHYDAIGLLKPAEVDKFTGYRYYAYAQLGRLNRILALKDLGFSLEQIAPVLEGELSAEQLRGMLKLKRAEIEQRIDAEQDRLTRIEARLRQIELENTMPNYEVILKPVPTQPVAYVRRIIPVYNQVGPLFGELLEYLGQHNAAQTLCLAIWHDEGYRERDVDAEAAGVLRAPIPEANGVKVRELPGGQMASVVHNGAYSRLQNAYNAAHAWIEANGYRIAGPSRELYHYVTSPVRQDDESYVTEIQIPVEKA